MVNRPQRELMRVVQICWKMGAHNICWTLKQQSFFHSSLSAFLCLHIFQTLQQQSLSLLLPELHLGGLHNVSFNTNSGTHEESWMIPKTLQNYVVPSKG
mmetsp:Transcript_20127/g.58196  ORF Transcript_20127/g.58196 Transcript_20127/m.58196 type:complete len:99 (+) Transcript_20127:25-321(+)